MNTPPNRTPTTPEQSKHQLWDLIKNIKFAMFTSRHGNGHLHAKPMTTQNTTADEDDKLWLFMSRGGDPLDDLAAQPEVHVSDADADAHRDVSVSGRARVAKASLTGKPPTDLGETGEVHMR